MNKIYFKLLIIISLIFTTINLYAYQDFATKHKIDRKILELWTPSKNSIETSITMLKDSPIELYFIGSQSYNLLLYAFKKKNALLIEELLQLYLKTIPYIQKTKKYNIYHLNEFKEKSTITLKKPIYIWSNKSGDEELISSAQFLFVLSFAVNRISDLPNKERTKTMNFFIKSFSPILLSHYKRWLLGVEEKGKKIKLGSFSRRGWGCKDKKSNYIYARTLSQMIEELGNKSYHGASYCNVIADPSLLIVSGLGYYLAGTEDKNQKILKKPFISAVKILSKTFKKFTLKDLKNKPINILSFQEGAWYGHPDYDYSEYNGSTFPKKTDKKSHRLVGVDVAHASRLLYLLEMLSENKSKFNIMFPTHNDMKMFTDGFLYKVFNQNLQKPLFKNYMNGSNGWFRVNYDSRKGYGYAPYRIGSSGAVLGGYPRLSKYNKKIEIIFSLLFQKFNSLKKEDRNFIHEFYEKTVWMEKKEREVYQFYQKDINPKSAIFLINFYSSMI
jgi:hypothetical protein